MSAAAKNSLLIVDDEASNLLLISETLGDLYTIYTAKEAKDAFHKANDLRPDLILLDIIMPEISGYHLLGMLKSHAATQNIPVIFISGLDSDEDVEFGLQLGVADYINKPICGGLLKKRIENQLTIVNLNRRIQRAETPPAPGGNG